MITTVFATELVKLRRTIAPWVTLGSLMTGPLFLALFMWIIKIRTGRPSSACSAPRPT